MGLQQYDPKLVSLVFGGALVTGYADGTFILVDFPNDLFTLRVGADGEGARSKSNNNSARITVTLMPGAVGNLVLGAALLADKAGGLGAVPVLITDLSTGTTYAGEGAWVTKDPGRDFAVEAANVEWVIDVHNLEGIIGAAA